MALREASEAYLERVSLYFRKLLGELADLQVTHGGPILLPGGGARATRHVYSGAVVKAILGLLGHEASFGRAYNLAQDETPSLRELLGALAALIGAAPRFVEIDAEAVRGAGLGRDGSRL